MKMRARNTEPDTYKERQGTRPKWPTSHRAKFLKRKKDRRPSEALNEEDKERKKKESLKTVCSSQRRFFELQSIRN